jgi:hypothetical protein
MNTPNIYISVEDGREQLTVNGALRLLGKLMNVIRVSEESGCDRLSRDQDSVQHRKQGAPDD